jgi:cell division protein FtsB
VCISVQAHAQVQEAKIAKMIAEVEENEARIRLLENSVKEAERENARLDLEKASLSEKCELLKALEATRSAEADQSHLQVRTSEKPSSITTTMKEYYTADV